MRIFKKDKFPITCTDMDNMILPIATWILKIPLSIGAIKEILKERRKIKLAKKDDFFKSYLPRHFFAGVVLAVEKLIALDFQSELIKNFFIDAFRNKSDWKKEKLLNLIEWNILDDFLKKNHVNVDLWTNTAIALEIPLSSHHGDLHPGNVFSKNNLLFFIDWSNYNQSGSRYFDLLDYYISKPKESWTLSVFKSQNIDLAGNTIKEKITDDLVIGYCLWKMSKELRQLRTYGKITKDKKQKYINLLNRLENLKKKPTIRDIKISCIIPTCDRPIKFLEESIESIINQSLKPLEIILVNNGKVSLRLPTNLAAKVKIFNIEPYAGASKARNFGALKASGDFIAFLDDDDLWNNKYLENVRNALESGIECLISRLDKKIDDEIVPYKNIEGNLTIKNLLLDNPGVTGSNIVISKKTFFAVGKFDENLKTSEDKSLVIELLQRNIPIKTLPDNQAIIREHNKGGRLSDPSVLVKGKLQFFNKYSSIMDTEAYIYNRKKISEYRYQNGEKTAIMPLVFFVTILKTLKILKFI